MKFSIVDAFADKIFGGNPAGIVILPEGADFPADIVMVKTAAELRYSETAFIKKTGDQRFKIRYFTPAAEVDLCGHATIGAFHALLIEGMIETGNIYIAETKAGDIAVAVNDGSILMDMADPQLFEEISSGDALDELYGIMGLSPVDQGICKADPDIAMIPRKVSTGLADIILPVRDEGELHGITPDFKALAELSRRYEAVGVHAFTINSDDGFIHVRNFAPFYEIDEEAATGTANGALTYYLYGYGIVRPGIVNTIVQGERMDRPSKISTIIETKEGHEKVKVGGSAVTLASGQINIDRS